MYLKKIQKFISEYNLELCILTHFIAFSVCFYWYPTFETLIVVSVWVPFFILYYFLFLFKIKVLVLTILPLFFVKLLSLNFYNLKNLISFYELALFLVCFTLVLVLIYFLFSRLKKTEKYLSAKKWFAEADVSEKIWLNHLTLDTPFFGALKESLSFLFVVVHAVCLLNNTFFFLLVTSKEETVSRLATSFLVLFLTLFFFSFLIEMWVLFCFNTFTKHPLFLFSKTVGKYVVAGISNAFLIDRVCISGMFEPPTNWAWCRSYQESQLGCVVRTKKELLSVNEYRGLGFKDPLPYTVVDGTKELDIDVLEGKINLKKKLNEVLKVKMEEAVDEAVSNFKVDTTKSYVKNGKDLELLAPPDTCPPGKNPESFEYDGNHNDRKNAAFRYEQQGKKKH